MYMKEIEEQKEEDREFGKVQWKVYYNYLKAGGPCWILLLMLSLFLAVQTISSMVDWWLSVWSSAEEERYNDLIQNVANSSLPSANASDFTTQEYIYIYIALIGLMLLFGIIRTLFFNHITINASKHIHSNVLQRMIRAPIRFFDTTPKGRIINRFSGDMYAVDNEVPELTYYFFTRLLDIAGRLVLMVAVNWYLGFTVLPCVILLCLIRAVYVNTCRHTARLEKTASSPFLGHLSSSIDGMEVIRAFGAQARCDRDFGLHQDVCIGRWYTGLASFVWFQFWCNVTGSLLNILVIFTCLVGSNDISAATVGLIFCLAIPLISMFQDGVKVTAELEIAMTNTERVLEYTTLDQEKSLETELDHLPPKSWPEKGTIQFNHVNFSYREGANVLKDLTFDIPGSSKIGIVGRTGAGKSSLVQALFRMAEAEGCMQLDGVDIQQLGLHDVRGKLSVIPQDPVLFSGTIRSNLDPQSQYSDASLWNSLEQVSMKTSTQQLSGQLGAGVSGGGSNWSAGERQLLCLARALLAHSKVLVLDEATANVDKRTDEIIQRTIRSRFENCTVLTIAHRLNTVMDSDKIMVLERGELVEYAEPHRLLQRRGALYHMVQQTGPHEASTLTHIAFQKHRAENTQSKTS